ncbi:MAG TPA: restriction endonuclease [Acidimicrobiales bacterium]
MSKLEDSFQRKIKELVNRVSGWTILALVLFLYPGVGLLLPLLLGMPKIFLIELNLTAVVMAMALGVGWLDEQLKSSERKRLLDWTSNIRLLDSTEFEWLVGEMFRREGWKVEETGQSDGPDGNIDLVLVRDGERVIVQCKRWESWVVGVNEIRNFAGTLMRENLAARSGIYVTLSKFGKQARSEANQLGIEIIDSHDLLARIDKVRRTEPCPSCGYPMILDHSVHGWWMRCVTQGCKGKRNLGREPGRAVELLTAFS